MRRRAAVLVLSALALSAGTARADEPPARVGLVVGVRVNVPPARAEALLAAMERVLERERAVDVVVASGPTIERDLPRGCATDSVCLSGLAARIEVDELLFLVLVGAGDRVRVELTRRHPVTGELGHPPALILDPEPERMERQIAAVVADLLPDARPPAAPPPEPAPPAPAPARPAPVDPRAGAGKRTAGLVVAAAGLALAGGGLFFAVRARSAADQLEDRHPPGDAGTWSEEDEALEDAHYRRRTWAAVLGIAGAAAVATGATLYGLGLRDRRRAREPGLSLRLAPGGGALVWTAAF